MAVGAARPHRPLHAEGAALMPSSEDCATLTAYQQGVDHAREEAETKWGRGRLPLLVSDDLRAKFLRQQVRWSQALQAAWEDARPYLTRDQLADVAKFAGAMQRAWQALDAAAEEAGHRPIFPDVMEAQLPSGAVLAVVRTDAEASKVIASGREVLVFTMREVANVVAALGEAVSIKIAWPDAKVQPPRDLSWVAEGDELPF
jgi:hypothetical protein